MEKRSLRRNPNIAVIIVAVAVMGWASYTTGSGMVQGMPNLTGAAVGAAVIAFAVIVMLAITSWQLGEDLALLVTPDGWEERPSPGRLITSLLIFSSLFCVATFFSYAYYYRTVSELGGMRLTVGDQPGMLAELVAPGLLTEVENAYKADVASTVAIPAVKSWSADIEKIIVAAGPKGQNIEQKLTELQRLSVAARQKLIDLETAKRTAESELDGYIRAISGNEQKLKALQRERADAEVERDNACRGIDASGVRGCGPLARAAQTKRDNADLTIRQTELVNNDIKQRLDRAKTSLIRILIEIKAAEADLATETGMKTDLAGASQAVDALTLARAQFLADPSRVRLDETRKQCEFVLKVVRNSGLEPAGGTGCGADGSPIVRLIEGRTPATAARTRFRTVCTMDGDLGKRARELRVAAYPDDVKPADALRHIVGNVMDCVDVARDAGVAPQVLGRIQDQVKAFVEGDMRASNDFKLARRALFSMTDRDWPLALGIAAAQDLFILFLILLARIFGRQLRSRSTVALLDLDVADRATDPDFLRSAKAVLRLLEPSPRGAIVQRNSAELRALPPQVVDNFNHLLNRFVRNRQARWLTDNSCLLRDDAVADLEEEVARREPPQSSTAGDMDLGSSAGRKRGQSEPGSRGLAIRLWLILAVVKFAQLISPVGEFARQISVRVASFYRGHHPALWGGTARAAVFALMLGPLIAALLAQAFLAAGARLLADPALPGAARAHESELTAVAVNRTTVVTSSYDGKIKFWDVNSGRLNRALSIAHASRATPLSVATGAGGAAIAMTEFGVARSDDRGDFTIVTNPASAAPSALQPSPDAPPAVRLTDAAFDIVEATGAPHAIARNWRSALIGSTPFVALAVPGDQRTYAIGMMDGRVVIEREQAAAAAGKSLPTGAPCATNCALIAIRDTPPDKAPSHHGAVTALAVTADRLASVAHDGSVILWRLKNGRLESGRELGNVPEAVAAATLPDPAAINFAAFSPDGARIITASSDGAARLWDAATGRQSGASLKHEQGVTSAGLSPDGARIITASSDNTARVWDAATRREIAVLRGHGAAVTAAAFSPDGARIITASADRTTRVWDAATGREIAVLLGHYNAVTAASFSLDGSRIITASSDRTARLWDRDANSLGVLEGHQGAVTAAAFSADGSRIVTASADRTARLWDRDGKSLAVLQGHQDAVTAAVFSPDGSRIITASADGTTRVWDAATRGEQARAPAGSEVLQEEQHLAVRQLEEEKKLRDDMHQLEAEKNRLEGLGLQEERRSREATGKEAVPPPASAAAGRRVALVIGNSAYTVSNQRLANPANDAQGMSKALADLGFEVVTAIDATKRDMDRALLQFARLASNADSALFFYAGHGMQYQGRNYLIPTDAQLEDDISISYETVSLDDVRAALDRTNGVRILMLDASRNNPLATRLRQKLQGSTRGVGDARGLAEIGKTEGMVVVFAAGAGEVAQDGSGRNSPFTAALLKRIQEPGVEIGLMLRRVASDVNIQTSGRQRPEIQISLLSEYYLNQNDRSAWERIKDRDDAAALREFLAKFPSSPLADFARKRLDQVEESRRVREESARRIVGIEAELADASKRLADLRQQQEERKRLAALEAPRPAAGTPIAVLRGHESAVASAAFSPDGARIVTASSDGTARVWDAATGKQTMLLPGRDRAVIAGAGSGASRCTACSSAAFSSDGKRLITAGHSGAFQVWDAETGDLIRAIRHDAAINVARLSADGAIAITAGDDGAARLWDSSTGRELGVIRGHGEAITHAELTPDGRSLITAARDGTVRVSSLAQAQMLHSIEFTWSFARLTVPVVDFSHRLFSYFQLQR
jgi:WD40 repeat protein